jgi:single-stranded DNA-binding protein
MNSVNLFGRVEDQPRLMGVPGRDVCEFWLRVEGRKQGHVLQVKVVSFERLAERCAERLCQGDQVAVRGRLRSDEYSQDPIRKTVVHSVIARGIDFVEANDADS